MEKRNNNQASNNMEFSESISAKDLRKFYEDLDEHKKETNRKVDDNRKEARQEIREAEQRLSNRMDLLEKQQVEFSKQQNNFDQRQNIFDLRLNTQDNKILFLSQQIESIRNEMSRSGQQAARNMNPNEIIPEPYPGEEELLKVVFLMNLTKNNYKLKIN